MLRQTPPLEATEAFLAATRAPSFRAAAAAMALSPSAFSRRIQLLESFLGAPLFDRSGSHMRLTQAGLRYREAIEPAVEAIRRASADVRAPLRDNLRVAISHTLAAEWLMPRLGRISRELRLNIDLTITRDRRILRDQEVDIAIWGAIEPEHGEGVLLTTLDAVPAAGADMADGRLPPGTIDELVTHRILGVRSQANSWAQWLDSIGYEGEAPKVGTLYDTNQLSYEAAACGLGVTLAVPLLANRYFEDGRLRACAAAPVPTGMSYWIHHASQSVRRNQQVRTTIDWLKEEAASSKQRFAAMVGTA